MVKERRYRKIGLVLFLISAFLLMAGAITGGIFAGLNYKNEIFLSNGLPIMNLKLNGTTLEEIHNNGKENKYGGNNLEIFYDGVINSYSNVEIKGRGNFSWNIDKKSYRIKFSEKTDLFGMGKKKKWALVGNGVDNSLMRNDLAYFISDILGGEYKMEGKFVELVIDGNDLGVYYLVKAMEIDNQTINLRNSTGVLAELDNVYCQEEDRWYEADNGDCFTIKDTTIEDNQEQAMEDFLSDYNGMLRALRQRNFKKLKEFIDIDSFVRYFLISEFAADPDSYATSWYFYKDGSDDKIHAGPIWDFDAAFGNKNWGEWPDGFYDPMTFMNRFEYTYSKRKNMEGLCRYDKKKIIVKETINISWTMCDLLNLPEFQELVNKFYVEEFQAKKDEIKEHIYEVADEIIKFARKDSIMWGKGDFDAEVQYLVEWVEKRFELFNKMYTTLLEDSMEGSII